MKPERLKNASRNILFGTILRIYQLLVPFFIRTVMIYYLGVEYVGLNSLFTSVLQVLNLAELGVGAAMTYSMYKPIVDNDVVKINALLNLYKKYYRIIGMLVLIAGLILLPNIPRIISGTIPADVNLYVLYLLNLFATVLTYWLFAYKNSIFLAHQRVDITSKIMLLTETIKYVLQFIAIYLFKDYYYFVYILVLTQLLNNVITAIISTKVYPQFKPQGELDKVEIKQVNQKIRDLFTAKLGGVILTSSDTIVISSFLGLSTLAIYQNYFFLITAVTSLLLIVFNSVTAGIGQSLITETKEKNFKDLQKFTFIIAWISGWATTCFLCLFQPFMEIWVGAQYLVEFPIVICLCVYFFISEINQLLNTYKDAAGIWKEDRFRPLFTSLLNLGLNLILVNFIGLYGVVLSTVVAMLFVGMPWLLKNLFTTLFEKTNSKQYISRLSYYVLVVIIAATVTYCSCSVFKFGSDFTTFIIKGVLCMIVPNIIFLAFFHKMPEMSETTRFVKRFIKG